MAAPTTDNFGLSYWAKSDDTLQAQPENPKFKVALAASYVNSHPTGGSDKLTNGHRFDTVAIANGLINAGIACQIIFYTVAEHDKFFQAVATFDGIIIRINPGQITANGGSQQKFDDDMMKLAAKVPVWPTPETMTKMGAKDALCHIKGMDFGLPDTLGYYSPEDMSEGFRKTIAFQPRVVKQNRGSAGEGIWIIKLKSGDYCDHYCDRIASDDEMLVLKEANDNHIEERTVAQFIEFCVNGRTEKSGEWTSKGMGKYFEGGREAGGQMVDQRFLPRIDEGEARFVMIGPQLNRVEHYVYIGGVGGETTTTIYKPDDEGFPYTEIQKKLEEEVPLYLKALGLPESALPLLWAADFIPVDGARSPLVIGEFNCSCLGLAGFLNVRGKDISELKDEDRELGMKMANLIGQKALESLQVFQKKPTYDKPVKIESKVWPAFRASLPRMEGKVVVVTGCTSGTGYICAKTCAELGARVIMLNRESERAKQALLDLQTAAPGANVTLIGCNLMSFESVREAAKQLNEELAEIGLDVLCNNAGIMATKDEATKDGCDTQMQTNHLSHFLLTSTVWPLLEKACALRGEARVANHSSLAANGAPLEQKYLEKNGGNLGGDYVDPNDPNMFNGGRWTRYHHSKLANVVFTYGLRDRAAKVGSKVKALMAHPGLASTNLQVTSASDGGMVDDKTHGFMGNAQSQEDGAMGITKCCCVAEVNSGDFYGPQGFVGPANLLPSMESLADEASRDMLWQVSEATTGGKFPSF